jgi:hypothetical protein
VRPTTGGEEMKLFVDELIEIIYEKNSIHFDFDEDMNGGECDCYLHTTVKTIVEYWGE